MDTDPEFLNSVARGDLQLICMRALVFAYLGVRMPR